MAKGDSRALYEMKLTTGMAYIYGPEGRKAHAKALEEDLDKAYRLVVNIVGRVRQGKTSLRRLLIGEEFNEHEMSTVGIEHELVETLGTTPNPASSWPKIDLERANDEECDLVVGKHVRERLKKKKGNKYVLQLQSFLKATALSYIMLFLYFTLAEMPAMKGVPWLAVMLTATFMFSGLCLFGTVRDGFGMAVGVLCLVIYADSALRWKVFEEWAEAYHQSCSGFMAAFVYYASIHAVMAFSMGISTAMGFCFVLCVAEPPWNDSTLDHSPFYDPLLHVFTMSILFGIWTLRFPNVVVVTIVGIGLLMPALPANYVFCMVSGLGCGYAHVIFIKAGFDTYVMFVNPVLKTIASSRGSKRCICYVIGIIPGIFICLVLGWNASQCVVLHGSFGLAFIAAIEVCHKVLEGKVEAAPKASIKNATKVLIQNAEEASLKFVIRDFAGHPLYHSVHHIYMMGHCVYMIAFNLAEAKRNFKYSCADILYWLQAVYVHDRYPSVRCFIVGTHRDDDSLSKDDIEGLCDRVLQSLPRQFHNMLVWNKRTEKPVFPVENSSRTTNDPDHMNLRKQLIELADDPHFKPKYPIKYLYFFRVINECRRQGRLIETLDEIQRLGLQHELEVTGDGELEDLLTFFHELGEVIYNPYDNNQCQMVVLDPKVLVEIMVSLVRAPPRSERETKFIMAWQTLEDLGIASKPLLRHILQKTPLISKQVSEETVTDLLQHLDLLCKLNLGADGRNVHGEECFLLTPLLKDTLPYRQNYWEDATSDTVLHIDFGPVVPRFIFALLVCQCASASRIDIGCDGSYHLNACTSKALFLYKDSCSYKLELQNVVENGNPSQQLLKIVIRGSEQDVCYKLARQLCQKIYKIIERDFRKCRYKIGVLCPFEGVHDYCQYQERHIFSLFESTKVDIIGVHTPCRLDLPTEKDFWCKGRRVIFRKGQLMVPDEGVRSEVPFQRQRSSLWDINVLDLPSRLYSDICDDLNLPNALGRNWKGLAGEFGKTTREVQLYLLRSPRDPCDALLQDWAGSTEGATLHVLADKVARIGRQDVLDRIEEFACEQR